MATVDDLTDVRSNENSSADVRLSSRGGLWAAPPLAPSGDEDDFYSHEPSDLSDTSGARTKLIAGTAVVVALGAAALAYFFLASPGVKAPAETAEIFSTNVFSNKSSHVIRDPGTAGSYCG